MITQEEFDKIMWGYDPNEIETRLTDIFNGYLGCDTGATHEELQQNHHMLMQIIKVFKVIYSTKP
jgi:hypothetical protein